MGKKVAKMFLDFWQKICRRGKKIEVDISMKTTGLDRAQALWNGRFKRGGPLPNGLRKLIKPGDDLATAEKTIRKFLDQ
ncbi:hypothetical protein HYV44_00065 [Candidatus Microgenomates bacterium]|nr:hypothetical protein [Candidatus Microgenomates bacterium]